VNEGWTVTFALLAMITGSLAGAAGFVEGVNSRGKPSNPGILPFTVGVILFLGGAATLVMLLSPIVGYGLSWIVGAF
jgi:hypothetical protein